MVGRVQGLGVAGGVGEEGGRRGGRERGQVHTCSMGGRAGTLRWQFPFKPHCISFFTNQTNKEKGKQKQQASAAQLNSFLAEASHAGALRPHWSSHAPGGALP